MNATLLTKKSSHTLDALSPVSLIKRDSAPPRDKPGRFELGLAIGLGISAVLWAAMAGVGFLAFRLLSL